ncbi:MAG: glycerol-3-phosphate 1-O-acyltransferase PlsY [Paracoccaceae bacterium]
MFPALTSAPEALILWMVAGYLLGSVPFGLVLTRLFGLGNLRDIGSGNIGATNVLRTGSKPVALATLVLDGGKGAVAVLLARAMVGEDAAQLAGLAAFAGHCFPVWLRFQGGKGVATFLGMLWALCWPIGALACLSWLVAAAISRVSSVGALAAAALTPIWMIVLGYPGAALAIGLAAMIFWRHSANIARLRAGTEPKIGAKTGAGK